jgi:hypothetical protein
MAAETVIAFRVEWCPPLRCRMLHGLPEIVRLEHAVNKNL